MLTQLQLKMSGMFFETLCTLRVCINGDEHEDILSVQDCDRYLMLKVFVMRKFLAVTSEMSRVVGGYLYFFHTFTLVFRYLIFFSFSFKSIYFSTSSPLSTSFSAVNYWFTVFQSSHRTTS